MIRVWKNAREETRGVQGAGGEGRRGWESGRRKRPSQGLAAGVGIAEDSWVFLGGNYFSRGWRITLPPNLRNTHTQDLREGTVEK